MKRECKRQKAELLATSSMLGQSKGQMQLSFGMIFSIILIIVFLGFAFYAIKTFIGFSDSAKAGKFFDSFQSDIDRVWKSSFSSEQQEYFVPSYVNFICLIDFSSDAKGVNSALYPELKKANYGSENAVFYPVKFNNFESKELNHMDTGETTLDENPLCIETNSGKVIVGLNKDSGKALVTITKP
jgi:hypothetical protein